MKFIKEDNDKKVTKQQSKLNFNRAHEFYTIYDSYPFRQNEILIDKPIKPGFAVLELSKLLMYETCFD